MKAVREREEAGTGRKYGNKKAYGLSLGLFCLKRDLSGEKPTEGPAEPQRESVMSESSPENLGERDGGEVAGAER